MFSSITSNIKIGSSETKSSAILWGALFYFISAVLLFSGVSKIIDPTPMIETMRAAFKINKNLLIFAATVTPIVEIALGLMLLLKIQTKKTLFVTTVLFFGFFAFSIYGTIIGLNTDCGCFGSNLKSQFGIRMIVRNMFWLIITLILNKISLPGQNKNP